MKRYVALEALESWKILDQKIGPGPAELMKISKEFPDAEAIVKSQADWLNSGPNE